MGERPARFVISVLARDHVGIIADVSETLYDLGANIEALSQTVVGDWFTMIARGAFPATVDAGAIKQAIEETPEFRAIVMPVGQAADREPTSGVTHAGLRKGAPFVVTAIGADKPGIVRRLARCFAGRGVNIDDVWNEVRDGQFIIIFHVTVPSSVDPKELRYELNQAAAELDVTMRLQHLDIFTATNSLSIHTGRQRL